MNALTRDKLLRYLKDAGPTAASIRVRLPDDEVREVARGGPRTPWKPVLAVLDETPWIALELLDKRGALLGAPLRNDAAATELENMPTMSGRMADVGQLSQIVTRAVHEQSRLLVQQTAPAFDALVRANADAHALVDLHRERANEAVKRAEQAEARERRAVEKLRQTQDHMTEVTEMLATVQREQPSQWLQLVQAAPQLATMVAQMAPLVRGLLGGGGGAAATVASAARPLTAVKP
jgi:hypothetical protein